MSGKPNPPKEYAREPIGRPSKFTEKRRNDIIDAISHRIPYEMAAEANGICLDTLYEWLKIGRNHQREGIDSDYAIFSEALKRAEMQKVRDHCDMIAAKPERWQADAWLLERRWHKHFSANAQLGELNTKMDKLLEGDKHENGNEKRNEEDDQEI
jgi:hypothetical protein